MRATDQANTVPFWMDLLTLRFVRIITVGELCAGRLDPGAPKIDLELVSWLPGCGMGTRIDNCTHSNIELLELLESRHGE